MLRGQHWKKLKIESFECNLTSQVSSGFPSLIQASLRSLQDGDELQAVTDDDQSLMDWRSGQRLNFWSMFWKQPRTSWVQNWSTNTSVVLYYKYNSSRSKDFSHKPILESIDQAPATPNQNSLQSYQSKSIKQINLSKSKPNQSKQNHIKYNEPIKETNKWKNEIK